MSNRIARMFALVAVCALAACAAPKTANAPDEGARNSDRSAMNGPQRIVRLDRPAVTVMQAFVEKGWLFDSLDREGGDWHSLVTLWNPDSSVVLHVLLFDPGTNDRFTNEDIERERYRWFAEAAFGGFERRLRSPSDGAGQGAYFYDVHDQGGQVWAVAGGPLPQDDGEDWIAETTHSASAQQKLWVKARLMGADRPEGLRAVTTDVVNTLAPLTLDPA